MDSLRTHWCKCHDGIMIHLHEEKELGVWDLNI